VVLFSHHDFVTVLIKADLFLLRLNLTSILIAEYYKVFLLVLFGQEVWLNKSLVFFVFVKGAFLAFVHGVLHDGIIHNFLIHHIVRYN